MRLSKKIFIYNLLIFLFIYIKTKKNLLIINAFLKKQYFKNVKKMYTVLSKKISGAE